MDIPSGIPTINEYHKLIGSNDFKKIEEFSNHFIAAHHDLLQEYGTKWVRDPLHTYNRQWEYPYVSAKIAEYVQAHSKMNIDILDAGSGATFYPFFLSKCWPMAIIKCCDQDRSLIKIFNRMVETCPNVSFNISPLSSIACADESFDIVYCISVLEHTNDYEKIIKEFKRVLKPNGMFIVTFDIALDKNADIPIEEARRLLRLLEDHFKIHSSPPEPFETSMKRPDLLNVEYIRSINPDLLPWKHPFMSAVKSALTRGRLPRKLFKDLTFFCGTYQKTL